jgi:hypothetical protein
MMLNDLHTTTAAAPSKVSTTELRNNDKDKKDKDMSDNNGHSDANSSSSSSDSEPGEGSDNDVATTPAAKSKTKAKAKPSAKSQSQAKQKPKAKPARTKATALAEHLQKTPAAKRTAAKSKGSKSNSPVPTAKGGKPDSSSRKRTASAVAADLSAEVQGGQCAQRSFLAFYSMLSIYSQIYICRA